MVGKEGNDPSCNQLLFLPLIRRRRYFPKMAIPAGL
jgi:hypothetical protein